MKNLYSIKRDTMKKRFGGFTIIIYEYIFTQY